MVYEACPFQYYRTFVLKVPAPVTPAMRKGTSIHALIAAELSQPSLFPPVLDPPTQALFDAFRSSRFNSKPIAVERPFSIPFTDADVAGRIDLILPAPGSGLEIVDFKSGRSRSPDDIRGSLQLPVYALAVREAYQREALDLRYTYFYLADAREVSFDVTPDLLETVGARVERIIVGISAGRFERRRGCTCFACRASRRSRR